MKNWRIKLKLWVLGNFYIPLLGSIRPKIELINAEEVRIRIKLNYRTRNHLKSMYFGALAMGADTAAGIHLFYFAELEKIKISFAFKKAQMEFIKRAESHVVFVCKEGLKLKNTLLKAKESGERLNEAVLIEAFDSTNELVARFIMTTSVKVK